MKSLSKNFLWAIAILFLFSALYSILTGQFQEKRNVLHEG